MSKTLNPKSLAQGEGFERPTAAEIEAWKKAHKTVYELETEDGSVAIMRKPTEFDMERAMMVGQKKGAKPLDFNRNIAKNCLLWSTPDFFEDDQRRMAMHTFVNELAAVEEVRSRKL